MSFKVEVAHETASRKVVRARRPRRANTEDLLATVLFAVLFAVPSVGDSYQVFILPQYMLFGVLAMSLCLVWGLGGILSFGQGAFFLIGAYALGILSTRVSGSLGVWLGIAVGIALSAAVAGALAYFLFRARVRGSYFVLVTLAISTIGGVIATSASDLTGGFNGMFISRVQLTVSGWGVDLASDSTSYYFVLALTIGVYVMLRWLSRSAFGRVLVGIRENEERAEALGYDVALRKTLAFSLSAAIAAMAGAIYGTEAGFVSPSLADVVFSTSIVLWVAIGGRDFFLGGLVGALAISLVSEQLNSAIPEYWQLLLGVLFLAVVIGFRRGIVGSAILAIERVGDRR
jgi:urea transport system permease protein